MALFQPRGVSPAAGQRGRDPGRGPAIVPGRSEAGVGVRDLRDSDPQQLRRPSRPDPPHEHHGDGEDDQAAGEDADLPGLKVAGIGIGRTAWAMACRISAACLSRHLVQQPSRGRATWVQPRWARWTGPRKSGQTWKSALMRYASPVDQIGSRKHKRKSHKSLMLMAF